MLAAMSDTSVDLQIGKMALDRGWISSAQLKEALRARATGRLRLVEILVSKGFLDPTQVVQLRNVLAIEAPAPPDILPAPAEPVAPDPVHSAPTLPLPPAPEPPPVAAAPEKDSAEARTSAAFRADAPPEVYLAAENPKNRVGKYILVRELGRGAMGSVHQAWDPELRRWAAVKFLLGDVEPDDLARFRREAETAAALRHPNIVRIYEVGRSGDRPYIAMDYIEGRTLAGRKLPARRACELLVPVARALETAHRQGIVHRDLKPQNIMLDADGKPCVMDFGLAKKLSQSSHLTASGTVMGTPSYMAPEQAQGFVSKVDGRSDVYALGAILYELLTGSPPFRGAGVLETLRQVVNDDVVPPRKREASVPVDVETVVLKCLQKERSGRYLSAGALADDLERFLADRPIAARPPAAASRLARQAKRNPAPLLMGAAVLLGAAAVVLLVLPGSAEPAPPAPLPPSKPGPVAKPPPTPEELSPARRQAQPEFDAGQRLLDQARLDLYRRGADLSKMKSNLEEAVRRFTNAVGTHPAFAEAFLGRGHARALLRRPAEAEKDFDRAAALLPASAAAPLARGHLLLERYLDTLAMSDWRRDELPPEVDAWRALALRDFQRARELGLEGDALLYLEASMAYAEEKLAESLAILDRLIAQAPSKEEYPKLRGDVRGALAAKTPVFSRDLVVQAAIDDYGRALTLRANYHEAYRRRGELLWRIGRLDDAYSDFEAGLRMDPNDSRALSDVGTYHQRTGRADLAERFFERAIAADAGNFRAWGNRGVLKMSRKDLAGAREDLERSLKINPNYLAATFNLAVCRELQGETDAALRMLTDIVSRRDDFTRGLYARGSLLFKNRRWGEALLDLEQAVARDPRAYGAKGRPMIEECRRRIAQK